MFQMLKSTASIRSLLTFHTHPPAISSNSRSRAGWSTALPKLPQLFSNLTSCAGPITANTIPKLGDVTSEIELVLLEPADVEFLTGCATLELAGDVFFIVADDSVSRNMMSVQRNHDRRSQQQGESHTW